MQRARCYGLNIELNCRCANRAETALFVPLRDCVLSRRSTHLRDTFGDPLFVLPGQRLVPTERALALRVPIRAVLKDAHGIVVPRVADLVRLERTLPVALPLGEIAISWHPRYHADRVHRWLREHVKATTHAAEGAVKTEAAFG